MEKNIVNLIMVLASMTAPADQTEGAHTVQATENIKIKLESIVPEKNPWIGKPRDFSNMARKRYAAEVLYFVI
jgi:hypothetical protein